MSETANEPAAPEAAQPDDRDAAGAATEDASNSQPSWDELFKDEDPAKVREALDQSRKWEQRAKANKKAADELEAQRQASMTEAEKAVAEAEARGRTAAVTEFGKRLARTEFDAFAGRRNPDFQTAEVFEWLDLSRFVGEDGEPDTKAIQSAVERLVPASSGDQRVTSFDGGARTPAPAGTDMNSILRRSAGRA